MRRLILTVLAPLGDTIAAATTLLVLHGLAWVLGRVYLDAHYGLAVVYATMALLATLAMLAYTVILLTLSLACRVPLNLVFLSPEGRALYLEEEAP